MNLSLNRSTNIAINELNHGVELLRQNRITELHTILDSHGLLMPARATHIDFNQLGMTELPVDLSDCDVEIIESLDGQCLAITTYHDVDALMKDARGLHQMIELGTAYQSGLKSVVMFDAPTAVVVRRSIAKARLAK